MTQKTEQNMRTRDEQVADHYRLDQQETVVTVDDYEDALREAEARGAEEQRRKDAEGQEPVAWKWLTTITWASGASTQHECISTNSKPDQFDRPDIVISDIKPLYTRPANVAALEAEIVRLREAMEHMEEESLRFSIDYSEGSDSRNTFLIFADKINARASITHEGGV